MIFYCLLADEMQYCSNKQDINIISWLTGEMVLHDISTLVTLNQEVTRDERMRKTKSDGDGER